MTEKTCCVLSFVESKLETPTYTSPMSRLEGQFQRLIAGQNSLRFISVLSLGLDLLAAELALDFRDRRASPVVLECIIPSREQLNLLPPREQAAALSLLARCDAKTFLWAKPTYVIDRSDYIFALHGAEGLDYAEARGKDILYLDEI